MQAGTVVGNLASAIAVQSGEAALVADLKAGSEEAFALLVALYHQPLYSVISRSLSDPSDAADITQEVFLKVFRSINGFHGDASLKTWLYRIALHEAANRRRWWSGAGTIRFSPRPGRPRFCATFPKPAFICWIPGTSPWKITAARLPG